MAVRFPAQLIVPGSEGWRVFRPRKDGQGWEAADAETKAGEPPRIQPETLIALPSLQFEFFSVRLPFVKGPEREAVLRLEMEGRGWQPEARDEGRIAWLVAEEGEQLLATSACWCADPLPADFHLAKAFVPSAWIYPQPALSVTLWREQGRLTASWCGLNADFPLHCQSLSSEALDAGLARELTLAELSLKLGGTPVKTETLVLLGLPLSPEEALELEEASGWRLAGESQTPGGDLEGLPRTIIPMAAQEHRDARKLRAQALGFSLFALLVLAVGAFLMIKPVIDQEKQLAVREAALAKVEPELSKLRDSRYLWTLLQPSLDAYRYPQEVLLRCVQQLPPEGIRVTEFEYTPDSFTLVGEASTAQTAISFQNTVKQKVALSNATWDTPSPGFQQDGRATFQIQARFDDVPEQP